MRTRWLAMGAAAVALGALAPGVANAMSATKLTAALNTSQEVPKPTGVAAGAGGTFTGRATWPRISPAPLVAVCTLT